MHYIERATSVVTTMAAAILLAACGDNNGAHDWGDIESKKELNAVFEVTLFNLSAGQPLSPMIAIAHNNGYSLFNIGESASTALEHLAEAGESAPLTGSSKAVYEAAVSSGGPLLPGPNSKATVTLTVPIEAVPLLQLSMASMLGNTNDGFAGLGAQSLAMLAVGTTVDTQLSGYDAGTERNTESADTVPGPATANAGGRREGFNASRDDIVNAVHLHPGVVSKDDGLPGSALTQAQRWDNPVALLSIKRIQ